MNVGRKLVLSVAILLVAFVALDLFILFSSLRISELSQSVAEDDLPGAFNALNMLEEAGELHANLLAYILGEEEMKEEFDHDYEQLQGYAEALALYETRPEEVLVLNELNSLIEEFYNRAQSEVFQVYKPEDERWALEQEHYLEEQFADPMEDLIDELLTLELEDAGTSGDMNEVLTDDIPGIRYYFELMDESEDLLMDMLEYLTGDPTAKDGFLRNSGQYQEAYSMLVALETRPTEVAQLNRIYNHYENIIRSSEAIFERYNPGDKNSAVAAVHDMEETILESFTDTLSNIAEEEEKEAGDSSMLVQSTVTRLIVIIIAAIAVVVVVGVILLIFNIRGIVSPLNGVVGSVKEISIQVAAASGQLSSTSQELANGAAEQASSLEEISNSMTQLSSMVTQNSENSRMVSQLSSESSDASQIGSDKMAGLLSAMEELSVASDEIKNIIGVIDGIAFQTNMLALNAAVEAARAGEVGMGFAVVADEVKNLANKSADSAQNTAVLIEDSIKKIQNSLEIAGNLSETFQDILQRGGKVLEMSKEVEASSEQQEEGILQINKAIAQLEKVVQSNAASAEEAASSAEEMDGQSGNLSAVVQQLVAMVSGDSSHRQPTSHSRGVTPVYSLPGPGLKQPKVTPSSAPQTKAKQDADSPAKSKGEELIPFEDEDEFEDY